MKDLPVHIYYIFCIHTSLWGDASGFRIRPQRTLLQWAWTAGFFITQISFPLSTHTREHFCFLYWLQVYGPKNNGQGFSFLHSFTHVSLFFLITVWLRRKAFWFVWFLSICRLKWSHCTPRLPDVGVTRDSAVGGRKKRERGRSTWKGCQTGIQDTRLGLASTSSGFIWE